MLQGSSITDNVIWRSFKQYLPYEFMVEIITTRQTSGLHKDYKAIIPTRTRIAGGS